MTKRGRDLFELLEMRLDGGASPRSRRQKKRPSERRQLRIGAWLSSLLRSRGRQRSASKPRRRKSAERTRLPLSVSGTWLAVLLLLALGGGFLLGRMTAGVAGPDELRTSKKVEKLEPGPLPAGRGSSDLGLQEEVATLSGHLLLVWKYPGDQRDQASALGEHLRAYGIDTARLRLATSTKTSENLWAVVVYVLDKDAADDYIERIKAVPPPASDETGWFARRLALPFKLIPLNPSNS